MLVCTVACLERLLSSAATVLELGAGTGLLTKKILSVGQVGRLIATDGAPEMLEIARHEIADPRLEFRLLDFTMAGWTTNLPACAAVISSMALHHAADKRRLFTQISSVLEPGGVFICADHVAGHDATAQHLIALERATVKGVATDDPSALAAWIAVDEKKQSAEGNRCESADAYLAYLRQAGFAHADIIWRDYWLAVFVARKATV